MGTLYFLLSFTMNLKRFSKKKKKENLLMKERKKNPKPKKSVYRTVKKKHSFNILISVHTENKKYLLKYCTKRPVEGI